MRVQSPVSNTCGLFCLYYAYFSYRGCQLEHILSTFSNNLLVNETVVAQFAKTCMHNNQRL